MVTFRTHQIRVWWVWIRKTEGNCTLPCTRRPKVDTSRVNLLRALSRVSIPNQHTLKIKPTLLQNWGFWYFITSGYQSGIASIRADNLLATATKVSGCQVLRKCTRARMKRRITHQRPPQYLTQPLKKCGRSNKCKAWTCLGRTWRIWYKPLFILNGVSTWCI